LPAPYVGGAAVTERLRERPVDEPHLEARAAHYLDRGGVFGNLACQCSDAAGALEVLKIVFAGDLEVAGWRRLLSLPSFRQDLICTSVFVASHHGRESGCCTELFDLFRPQLVIISDDERQFDSQDTDDWYRDRCAGAIFAQNPNMRRYVATTRKDGSMRIDVDAAGRWWIRRVLVRDWPRNPIPASPRRSGLGALASLGFGHNPLAPGANVLLSAFSTPPVPPKPEPSLGALLSIDNDPLARALGLGSLLAPTPVKR
jgi:hypothetical protein